MKIRRILAAALVAVMVMACAAPAFAADSTTNMLKDATLVEAININDNGDNGFEGLIDGGIAVGPTHMQMSLNGKIGNINKLYDADGNESENGEYIWMITYELLNKATLESVSIYSIDLAVANVNNTVPWLLHDFDILVSDTGAAGSWKLAYRAEELHDGFIDSDYYEFVEAHDDRLDYWVFSDKFEKPVDAKFVKLAVPTLTNETLSTKNWVNISEIEINGKLASGVTAVTKAPETKAPAPVNAAGQTDVVYDSTIAKAVNIQDNGNKEYAGLVDGVVACGPTHQQKSLNGKISDIEKRYDVNGEEKEGGEYIWLITFEMPHVATIESVELDCVDLAPLGVGVDNTIPWLVRNFDIYVSDTGAAGSWKLAHSAKDLHDGESTAAKYTLVEADNNHVAYYAYAARLNAPVSAKFVTLAAPTLTNETLSTKNWVNITEFQLFGQTGTAAQTPAATTAAPATTTAAPAVTTAAPATTTAAPATTTKAPASTTAAPATTTQAPASTTAAPANTTKAPTTQAQQTPATSPKTVDASVVIAVVIAAAAAGAVVIGKKKH